MGGLILCIAIIAGFIFLNKSAGNSLGNKRTCPNCGNTGMKANGGGYYRNGQRGIDWDCPHCGHQFFG